MLPSPLANISCYVCLPPKADIVVSCLAARAKLNPLPDPIRERENLNRGRLSRWQVTSYAVSAA